MDWDFGSGVNDFLVPKDHEILNGHPAPSDSWLQWGQTDYESMESLSKYIVPEKTSTPEAHAGSSTHLMENSSSNSSGILSEGSLHQSTLLYGRPNYLLNEGAGTDHVDDTLLYMSSFLDPSMESLNESFGFSPEFQYGSMSTDDPLIELISDSQQVPSNLYSIKRAKFLNTDDLSHSMPSTSGKQNGCPPAEVPVPVSQSEATGEEASAEACALQELQGAMAQLNPKTRICFRDSLYRLAKNSEQQHMLREGNVEDFNVQSTPNVDHIPRSRMRKTMESETNAIDRAIANLMFSKRDLNGQTLSPATSAHTTRQGN